MSKPNKAPFAPSHTIYFANVPCSVSEEELWNLVKQTGASPYKVKFIPGQGDPASGKKFRAGFVDFHTVPDAILGMMAIGHVPIGGVPVRLEFASRPTKYRGKNERSRSDDRRSDDRRSDDRRSDDRHHDYKDDRD